MMVQIANYVGFGLFLALAPVLASCASSDAGATGAEAHGSGGSRAAVSGSDAEKTPGSKASASALPVDCREDASSFLEVCETPSCDFAGTIGSGASINCAFPFGVDVGSGFIEPEQNRLVVALEASFDNQGFGLIAGIELSTGNRTLLSGSYEDSRSGSVTRGEGPSLFGITGVRAAPDGKWVASADAGLISIDPETGDRELLLESGQKIACAGVDVELFPSWSAFIVDQQGAIYGTINHAAYYGVLKLDPDTLECSALSVVVPSDPSKNVGQGIPDVQGLGSLALHEGQLWAVERLTRSLLRIDPVSGDRTRVSCKKRGVGKGDADLGTADLAIGVSNLAWTFNENTEDDRLVSVDRTTGDRSGHVPVAGPAKTLRGGGKIWLLPSSSNILIGHDGAFILYDPKTENSNLLSW